MWPLVTDNEGVFLLFFQKKVFSVIRVLNGLFFIKPKTRHFASRGIKTFKSPLKFIQPLMGSVTFKHYCCSLIAIIIIINVREQCFFSHYDYINWKIFQLYL